MESHCRRASFLYDNISIIIQVLKNFEYHNTIIMYMDLQLDRVLSLRSYRISYIVDPLLTIIATKLLSKADGPIIVFTNILLRVLLLL